MKDYVVKAAGFVAGVWREKDEVIAGTKDSMRYLVLAGQVEEKKPVVATASEERRPELAEPRAVEDSEARDVAGGRGKRK